MRKLLMLATMIALVIGGTESARAQVTTGSIFGVVTDESGAVLPGVTVTLASTAVPGSPTEVTSENGSYRFPALPPGTYTLSFELQGFATLNRDRVALPLASNVEINVQMKVGGVAETVTVTGESPVVDTTSTEVSTNYNREWVQNAPVPRFTFFDLINAAPGVSASNSTGGQTSTSYGAGTTDSSYMLDGTDFTAPSIGTSWPWPNTDAIEEVEVLSLGATAEYGNLMGAVFNIVTRQGSNTFHGDANYYFQSDGLTGRNTTIAEECAGVDDCPADGLPYHREKYNDATIQLGGPVIKDRFWFFGSFQYQQDYQSLAGTPPEFPGRFKSKRVFFKLNYQLNNNNKVQFQYHDDFYDIPDTGSASTAPSARLLESGHNPSPGVVYTSVLTNKTVFEARYSGFYGNDHGAPLFGGPKIAPHYYDLDTGLISGGIYAWYDGSNWKTGASAKVTHYADRFIGGSHDIKLGVQYNSGGSDYAYGYNDYIYTYGGVPAYGYTQLPFGSGAVMKGIGIYVDDTMRVGSRLTLNLGLRYDYSKGEYESKPVFDRNGNETGAHTAAVNKVFDWNSVSPRVGVTWKLNETGKTVLKGHYGRYYRGIVTGEFDGASPAVSAKFGFAGTYDDAGNPLDTFLVSDNTNLKVDPGFGNPYTDQFIMGVQQELRPGLGLTATYIYKRGEHQGGWQDTRGVYTPATYVDSEGADATGQPITVQQLLSSQDQRLFLLTNPSGMFSRYKGLDIQLEKRLANNWQATFGLTFSKANGRLGSSRGGPAGGAGSTAGEFGQNPNDFINTDGLLTLDRPVILKTQMVYELPLGFTVAGNYQHQTGRPWGRQVRVSDVTGFETTIFGEKLSGDRRTSGLDMLDVRIEKHFETGHGSNVAFFGDILNLTNSSSYEDIVTRLGTASNFGVPTRFIYPRRLMLGAKFRF
jgi:outer membrane receptor protein involved in Fe transport